MNRLTKPFFTLLLLAGSISIFAQQAPAVVIEVTLQHKDWLYNVGQPTIFEVKVKQDGKALQDTWIRYEIGPEKMDPTLKDSVQLKKGSITLKGGTLQTPGFLRCTVKATIDGKEYKNTATAGFEPFSILPTIGLPDDFSAFWHKSLAELSSIPLSPKMELQPQLCTDSVNVYHVSFRNIGQSSVYGSLCVPKKPGKYPAVLSVPGAGVGAFTGNPKLAAKGVITLSIGIHGIPVNMPKEVYDALSKGALSGYQNMYLEDRDRFYYKRVYLGCVRANDFLTSLPEYDGSTLGVIGGSQGGALAIVTAALDPRVKFLGAFYPALSDVTGYLHNRAGGWPHYFAKGNLAANNKPERIATVGYYDVVNFARILKVPGFYSWGYNDEVCPPTSYYAAYNMIKAPTQLFVVKETGHNNVPAQWQEQDKWLFDKLGIKD